MNDKYLWDKQGSDAEIEGLENVLAQFRYTQDEAPAFPVVKSLEARQTWRIALGFAASAAAFAVVLVLAFQFSRPAVTSQGPSVSEVALPGSIPLVPDEAVTTKQAPVNTAFTPDRVVKRGTALYTTGRTAARKNRPRSAAGTLTKEEKYAYGQVLLALSITSSKLQLVQSTINRIENPPQASDGGK